MMMQRVARKLFFGGKPLSAAARMIAVAAPILFGFMNATPSPAQSTPAATAPPPAFEVVSIKPNKGGMGVMIRMAHGSFEAKNITVKLLLQEAYGVKESQISGAPPWIDSEHYDIEAKPDDSFADAERKLSRDEAIAQHRQMLQSLLADRFKLTLHHDSKELQIYSLVVAKNGPKFHEAAVKPSDSDPPKLPEPGGPAPKGGVWMTGRGEINVTGASLSMFSNVLSMQPEVGRIVLDNTGLKGNYEFTLKWTPDESQGQMFGGPGAGPDGRPTPPPNTNGPTIFTALQEQLGLKLESQKGPVDTLVIDHVERPSEN
jgi:uncharacterized protein (TIGR03435 family)